MNLKPILFFFCLIISFKSFSQDYNLSDTIQVKWDTLKKPGIGANAARYNQYGDSLYHYLYHYTDYGGVALSVRKSGDNGKTWQKTEPFAGQVENVLPQFYFETSRRFISSSIFRTELYNYNIKIRRISGNNNEDWIVYSDSVKYSCFGGLCGGPLLKLETGTNDSTILLSITTDSAFGGFKRLISTDFGTTWKPYVGFSYNRIVNNIALNHLKTKILYTRNKEMIYGGDSINLLKVPELGQLYGTHIAIKDSFFTLVQTKDNSTRRYTTSDKGNSWLIDTLPYNFQEIKQYKDTILIITKEGIFKTTDIYFKNLKKAYPKDESTPGYNTGFSMLKSGWYLNNFNGELLRSTDSGESWNLVNNTEGVMEMKSLNILGDSILLKSALGFHFTAKDFSKLDLKTIDLDESETFAFKRENAYFKINRTTILRSTDYGKTWKNSTFFNNESANNRLKYDSTRIYLSSGSNIRISYNNGESFIRKTFNGGSFIEDILFVGKTAYCLIYKSDKQGYSLLKSTDECTTWTVTPFFHPTSTYRENLVRLLNTKNKILVTTSDKIIYESRDSAQTWKKAVNQYNYEKVIQHGKHTIYLSESSHRLKITADEGLSFTHIIPNLNHLYGFKLSDNYLYTYPLQAIFYDSYYPYYSTRLVQRIHLDSLVSRVAASENYAILRGAIFKDENGNCQKDTAEKGVVADKIIRVMPRNYTVVTDNEGKFEVALPPDTYTLTTENLNYFKTSCSDSILKNIVLKAKETKDTNFVFKKLTEVHDLVLSLSTGSRARPGFELDAVIKIENSGTEKIDSALVKLEFPKNYINLMGINQNTNLNDNPIIWKIYNLGVGDVKQFNINMNVASTTPLSTELFFKAIGQVLNKKDTLPLNNVDSVKLTVTGAFDPNDKTVLPEGKIPFFTTELDYLIRFQNTGTDTAFKVVVRDTLPYNLEPLSIKSIVASHPYVLSIKNNILTFTFDKILLPDSNVNERASHGFIRFKIKPIKDLYYGGSIQNKAAIFFDFNDPIITNIANSELIKPKVFINQAQSLCEGDAYNGKKYFTSTTRFDTLWSQRYDTIITTQITVNPLINIFKDTTIKRSQLFLDKTWNEGDKAMARVKALSGCDTIMNYTIHILSTATAELPTEFNSFIMYPNPATDYLSISYEIKKATKVEISLYNMMGQKLKNLSILQQNTEGVHHISNDLKDVQSGSYQVGIKTESGTVYKRFIKM